MRVLTLAVMPRLRSASAASTASLIDCWVVLISASTASCTACMVRLVAAARQRTGQQRRAGSLLRCCSAGPASGVAAVSATGGLGGRHMVGTRSAVLHLARSAAAAAAGAAAPPNRGVHSACWPRMSAPGAHLVELLNLNFKGMVHLVFNEPVPRLFVPRRCCCCCCACCRCCAVCGTVAALR